MYLLVIFFPFAGFATVNLFGRLVGNKGSSFITTFYLFCSFIVSCFIFIEVGFLNSSCHIDVCPWLNNELLIINWSFCFDTLTAIMLVTVSFISSLVHLYSTEYMEHDPHQSRFMSYLSLFTFFMLILVTADNFVLMFLGWEGIGLASYLLISFWYTRIQANKSAIKAMLINRVGDFGLVLSICAIFMTFKSLDYSVVFGLVQCCSGLKMSFFSLDFDRFTIFSFFLFFGALGKSAQLGLHVWLPDAMEAPTPVSALLHAATLVTAGLFLIIRCSFIFEQSDLVLTVIILFGSLTAFFASSVGVVQNDMKRVIAYSTCSQLGYMMFACGLSQYSVAIFHLANHALFKALLFLSAGGIIHGLGDLQDLRRFGATIKIFPIFYVMILIGSIALTGIPFFTGFYSKDCILNLALAHSSIYGNFAYVLGTLAACCTAFYSCRLIFYVFVNHPNGFMDSFEKAHQSTLKTLIPLFLLGFGSIFAGFLLRDLFLGFGSNFFGNSVFYSHQTMMQDFEFAHPFLKNVPLIFTVTGILISIHFCLNLKSTKIVKVYSYLIWRTLYVFLSKKWNFDQVINEFVVNRVMTYSFGVTFLCLDKGIIENVGPTGSAYFLNLLKKSMSCFHSGFIPHQLLIVLWFITFVFGYSFFVVFVDSYRIALLVFAYVIFSLCAD